MCVCVCVFFFFLILSLFYFLFSLISISVMLIRIYYFKINLVGDWSDEKVARARKTAVDKISHLEY